MSIVNSPVSANLNSNDSGDVISLAKIADSTIWTNLYTETDGYIIVDSVKDLLQGIESILGEEVGEKYRRSTMGEADRASYYFARKDGRMPVSVDVDPYGPPRDHFDEEDIQKSQKAYYVRVNGFSSHKTRIAIQNLIYSFEEFNPPLRKGEYPIFIIESWLEKGETKRTVHHTDTSHMNDITPLMYPGIDMGKMLEAYHESDEKVTIFIGRPGTGKTSFMKLLLRESARHMQDAVKALYVKDVDLLHQASFWSKLTKQANDGEIDYLILDDLDRELLPRDQIDVGDGKVKEDTSTTAEKIQTKNLQDNFTIVNKLLSLSDGLFSNDLKILITSNLESQAIDPAIIRPGRCFDILKIPFMTVAEARKVWAEQYGLTDEAFDNTFSEVLSEEGQVVSQSLLASEAKEALRDRVKGAYLIDKSISVRDRFM